MRPKKLDAALNIKSVTDTKYQSPCGPLSENSPIKPIKGICHFFQIFFIIIKIQTYITHINKCSFIFSKKSKLLKKLDAQIARAPGLRTDHRNIIKYIHIYYM